MGTSSEQRIFAFIGTYAEPDMSGLYACTFNNDNGALTIHDEAGQLTNPSFLDVDDRGFKLYAIAVGLDTEGHKIGEAAAYSIDAETGKLTFLNRENNVPAPTCHITLDQSRSVLMVSSYHGGMLGFIPLMENGHIGPISDIHVHTGSSVLPVQDRPRVHSVTVDRNNKYAVVCDLGLDRIKIYSLDIEGTKMIEHSETIVQPGAGPRHFTFHPALPYGYVINELDSTVNAYEYDHAEGKLTEIQSITTLPNTFEGSNSCADIHISPDGLYLYGSNRGDDSIVVYQINQTNGRLTLVEHVSTKGQHPRNFAISPDGSYLLVANMNSNNIVTFVRDSLTGKLQHNGQILQVSKPVCIRFLTVG